VYEIAPTDGSLTAASLFVVPLVAPPVLKLSPEHVLAFDEDQRKSTCCPCAISADVDHVELARGLISSVAVGEGAGGFAHVKSFPGVAVLNTPLLIPCTHVLYVLPATPVNG
jgi:hypothetical protein